MNYIHQPGDPQARPPYTGENVLLNGGFLKCDGPTLQSLCDQTLNQVDPDLHFTVVGDRVLFAGLYAEKMRSAHPEDSEYGYVSESDVGLWILTWGGRRGSVPALRWMPAFIFVDSPSALMTGRELYGYPKHLCRAIRDTVLDEDFTVDVKVVCFAKKDPNIHATSLSVLKVDRMPGNTGLLPGLGALLANFVALIFPTAASFDNPAAFAQAISGLLPPFIGMPMLFLRQMRDVTAVDGSVRTEIAAATVQPTAILNYGSAFAQRLTIPPVASFPIVKTLGCAQTIDMEWPFWVRLNFQVGTGQRL